MNETLIVILSFGLGLTSGFVGALSSGGGLISIPGLIFMGLSPSAAIATTRLNVLSAGAFSLYRYNKQGVVQWKEMLKLIPIAIVGGVLGSKILLDIDEQTLEKIVGLLLLCLA